MSICKRLGCFLLVTYCLVPPAGALADEYLCHYQVFNDYQTSFTSTYPCTRTVAFLCIYTCWLSHHCTLGPSMCIKFCCHIEDISPDITQATCLAVGLFTMTVLLIFDLLIKQISLSSASFAWGTLVLGPRRHLGLAPYESRGSARLYFNHASAQGIGRTTHQRFSRGYDETSWIG